MTSCIHMLYISGTSSSLEYHPRPTARDTDHHFTPRHSIAKEEILVSAVLHRKEGAPLLFTPKSRRGLLFSPLISRRAVYSDPFPSRPLSIVAPRRRRAPPVGMDPFPLRDSDQHKASAKTRKTSASQNPPPPTDHDRPGSPPTFSPLVPCSKVASAE